VVSGLGLGVLATFDLGLLRSENEFSGGFGNASGNSNDSVVKDVLRKF
jgi:hypothetical protein